MGSPSLCLHPRWPSLVPRESCKHEQHRHSGIANDRYCPYPELPGNWWRRYLGTPHYNKLSSTSTETGAYPGSARLAYRCGYVLSDPPERPASEHKSTVGMHVCEVPVLQCRSGPREPSRPLLPRLVLLPQSFDLRISHANTVLDSSRLIEHQPA